MYEEGDIVLTRFDNGVMARAQIVKAWNSIYDIPEKYIPEGGFLESELKVQRAFEEDESLKWHWYLLVYLEGSEKGRAYLTAHFRILFVTKLELPIPK